jgi:hypothetical protein
MAADELADEREAAYRAIRAVGLYPVLFEREAGSTQHFTEWWRGRIETCDLFLILLDRTLRGAVYDEIRTAHRHGKPILVYPKSPERVYSRRLDPDSTLAGKPFSDADLDWFYEKVTGPKAIHIRPGESFEEALTAALWEQPQICTGFAGRLRRIRHVFVRPAQWDVALQRLSRREPVVLVGPPHIGKTSTGLALLDHFLKHGDIRAIHEARAGERLGELQRLDSYGILADDPFGSTALDRLDVAGYVDEFLRVGLYNHLVATTRAEDLDTAIAFTKAGESALLRDSIVQMQPGESYTRGQMNEVLQRHVAYMTHSHFPERERIDPRQAGILLRHRDRIVAELRFPHNLGRLVAYEARKITCEGELDAAIKRARWIEDAVAIWYRNLADGPRVLVAALALFPNHAEPAFRTLYTRLCRDLGAPRAELHALLRHSGDYLRSEVAVDFGHPSYRRGVLATLRAETPELTWEILRARTACAAEEPLESLMECLRAEGWFFGASRYGMGDPPPVSGAGLSLREYLGAWARTYERVVTRDFPSLDHTLGPPLGGPIGVHVSLSKEGEPRGWTVIRRSPDAPPVESSVEARCSGHAVSQFERSVFERRGSYPVWRMDRSTADRLPELDAVEDITRDVIRLIREERLIESWQIVYDRTYQALAGLAGKSTGGRGALLRLNLDAGVTSSRLHSAGTRLLNVLPWPYLRGRELAAVTTWPPDLSIGSGLSDQVNLRQLASDVAWLEAGGHVVRRRLLPEPDIPFETLTWRVGGVHIWDAYTDAALERAGRRAIRLLFDAYRETVEINFPTLRGRLWRHSTLPVDVLCVIDRQEDNPGDGDRIYTMVAASEATTAAATGTVRMVVVSDASPPSKLKRAERLIRAIIEPDWSRCVWTGGLGLGSLVDARSWRQAIYSWIARDVEAVLTPRDRDTISW